MNKQEINRLYELTKEEPLTEEYKEKIQIFVETRERILRNIGEEHRQDIEELTNLINDIGNEQSKQAHYKGFSMAVKLLAEAIN